MIAVLRFLGRNGTQVIASGVFLGLLVPGLSPLFTPLLVPAILLPLLIALLRLDASRLRALARAPLALLALLLWLLVLSPLLVRLALAPLAIDPPLSAYLVSNAACAPLLASGALALLLGLDVTLALTATVAATLLVPFTLPPLALGLAGMEVPMASHELALRLALLIGGCALVAALLRIRPGAAFFAARAVELDGLAVLALVAFSVAVMGEVREALRAAPGDVLTMLLAVFALNMGLQLSGSLLAWRSGARTALTVGLLSGNNNIGIVLAALADRAPESLLVYVALAQFPIYLLPILQKRLYRRLLSVDAAASAPHAARTRTVSGPPGRR